MIFYCRFISKRLLYNTYYIVYTDNNIYNEHIKKKSRRECGRKNHKKKGTKPMGFMHFNVYGSCDNRNLRIDNYKTEIIRLY